MSTLGKLSVADLKQIAWQKGDLSYLLGVNQRKAKSSFHNNDSLVYAICCSRRWGKSRLACVMCLEQALQKPRAQIRYAAPTKEAVKKIVGPLMEELLMDCPAQLKPKYDRQDAVWRFPNGSEIHVAGVESGTSERLRGTSTDFAVVDEAGFIDDNRNGEGLEYLVDDILMPQTLTTKGRILLISTPSFSAAHAFNLRFCLQAQNEGAYLHQTIYDAPHIDPIERDRQKARVGGEDSSTWQREFMARVIVDENVAVIPEFSHKEAVVVQEVPRPEYFDTYVGLDLGYHDLTAIVFGYYDFQNARLVIEDELVFHKTNSGEVVRSCKAKESTLWGQPAGFRVCDTNMQNIRDLAADYNYTVTKAKKDEREACLNNLRLWIAQDRLVISPKCKRTIAHLKGAIWNKNRTEFARSGKHGHFDCVAALMYLCRSVRTQMNPFPLNRGISRQTHHFGELPESKQRNQLRKLIKRRRR